jgi:hypothetical protein
MSAASAHAATTSVNQCMLHHIMATPTRKLSTAAARSAMWRPRAAGSGALTSTARK